MRLARLTIPGVLAGGALALELYASVQVAMGVVAGAFRVWPLRLLHMVQNHRDLLEQANLSIVFMARSFCVVSPLSRLRRTLRPGTVYGPSLSQYQVQRGSISTSVGDIVAFFLTVLAAYLLSAFIRFVLEQDVYSRTRIATGQSYAVSSLLNYSILAIGFRRCLRCTGDGPK